LPAAPSGRQQRAAADPRARDGFPGRPARALRGTPYLRRGRGRRVRARVLLAWGAAALAGRAAFGLAAAPAASIVFTDATAGAGIRFKHNSGAFGKKYLPETMGSGGAWLDFD